MRKILIYPCKSDQKKADLEVNKILRGGPDERKWRERNVYFCSDVHKDAQEKGDLLLARPTD